MDESDHVATDKLLKAAQAAFAKTNFVQAEALARDALAAYRKQKDILGEARSLSWLGAVMAQLSRYPQALEALSGAVKLFIELGKPERTGHARNYIGVVYEEIGDLDRAFHHYAQALEAARLSEDSRLEGRVLANIGEAYVNQNAFDLAMGHLEAAASVLKRGNDASLLGWVECTIARLHQRQGQLQEAGRWFARAIETSERGDGKRRLGEILAAVGEFKHEKGQHEEAIACLTQALDIARNTEVRRDQARAHEGLARVYEHAGEFERSLLHFKAFHRIHADMIEGIARVRINNVSAEIELERERLEKEMSYLKNVELADALEKLERQTEMLERLSTRDALTGAFNRRYLDQCLVKEFKRARRHGTPLSLAMVDADHFKQINDRFSHATGDYVLAMICEIIASKIRSEDVLARFGGEEFVLLFPETSILGAVRACEKIRQAIADHRWQNTERALSVTLSFGVADCHGAQDWEEMMAVADRHLYRAKDGGRNRVCPSVEEAAKRVEVATSR